MICRRIRFLLPLLLLLAVPGLAFAEGKNEGGQDTPVFGPAAPATPIQTITPSDQNTPNTPASSEKTPKKPKPSASPDASPSGNPSPQPSPTTEASPSASPDAPVQAMTADESPEPSIPKPVQSDPMKFLDGFKGNYDTDLFTGSASYAFPLAIPPGRGKATPTVSLNYSSSGLNLLSPVGLGWSLPTNAIFRNTAYGVNNLYTKDDYAADIFGNYAQLIVTDTTNKIYAAKTEGAFISYDFDPPANSWTAIDKEGTKYFFGTSAASRHTDPADSAHTYKWLLDKVQDTNGNTIVLTYFQDSGQVYPDTIRYSGDGTNPGIYELRFPREARPNPPVSYVTGFAVTTNYRITSIDLYSWSTGSPVLARSYDLSYLNTGTTTDLLSAIAVSGSGTTMPPVSFQYVDNTETLPAGVPPQKKYLLKKITNPEGGTVSLLYKPSSAYRDPSDTLLNNHLSFVTPTLYQTVITDSVTGLASTTAYEYEGGHYFYDPQNAFTREYAGFHTVTVTDSAGNVTKEYFHQSQFAQDNAQSVLKGEFDDHISKRGRAYRIEQYDNTGKLFTLSIRKWNKTQITDANPTEDAFFPYLERETNITFDGQTTGRATAVSYTYDQYGNRTQAVDYGEVTATGNAGDFTDIAADKLTTTIEYALNTTTHILSLPKRSLTTDQNSVTVAEQKLSYDTLAYGTAPTKGNPTKSETLISSTPSTQYAVTQTAYNSYGLPTSITNARNYTTTIAYDSQNLYPATVTNPKNQIIAYTYNYLFEAPEQITDPNNFKTKYTYDGLGRLTKTEVSDPANPTQLLTQATYAYDLTAAPVSVTATTYTNNNDVSSAPIQITAKTYLDGLGRSIQTRTEWEGSNNYLVVGTVYDSRGNVKKTLLPQFGTGTAFDAGFNETKPGSANTYDALNRVTSTVTPYGTGTATTTIAYDRWTKTVTDARNFKKDFVSDARGNLTQVKEYLTAGSEASPAGTTTYTYDALKNLIKITDASGNIKNLTYDLLGHKLTEEDFHAPSDATFSHWTSIYDANGNMTSVVDAKNQTTNYIYDELDRLLTEDFTGQAGTEVAYVYDTAPNGKGRPATITTIANSTPIITKAFEYDLLGHVAKETRTINSVNYVTQTEYDLAGNPKRIIYPDAAHTEELSFYNNAGQLEKVQKKQGATTTDLVTNFDYTPTGAPQTIAYANGVTTTNTYDIIYLYYLTHKVTAKGATKLQDISYTFDPTGNITGITDVSQTNAAKTVAYTYDGLSRLTAATATNAANGQNYAQTFAYDILGNITNKSDVGAYTYAQTDYASPHAVTNAGGKTYAYDNNGNLSGDGTWTHAWDYKDRLLSSSKTGAAVTYNYDEGGTRVIKKNTTSGKTTIYVNDLLDIETGTEKLSFYAGDLKLATLEGTGASSGTECTVPASGDWTITANCTIFSFKTAPGNVTVNAGVTLTIAPAGILEVNLNTKKFLVKSNGKVFVQQGGAIAQIGRLTSPQSGQQSTLVFHHTDHLSGASVDTDTTGNVLQLTDYYPYGDSRIESTTTAFHNDYTYTGKERDEDTTLLYYEARYYDSHIGRFISADLSGGNLQDPQKFNTYTYVRNNPLAAIDPDGKLTVFIHGTYSDSNTFDTDYKNKVTADLGDQNQMAFSWSGGNSVQERTDASSQLVNAIKEYKFAPGEELNIVAHSHGGNVAIGAINEGIGRKVDTLIILGTPVRDDQPGLEFTRDRVGSFVNVYSTYDNIQTKGKFLGSPTAGYTFRFRQRHSMEDATEVKANTNDFGLLHPGWYYHSWLKTMDAWENAIKPQLVTKGVLEYDTNSDGTVKKHSDGSIKTKKKE